MWLIWISSYLGFPSTTSSVFGKISSTPVMFDLGTSSTDARHCCLWLTMKAFLRLLSADLIRYETPRGLYMLRNRTGLPPLAMVHENLWIPFERYLSRRQKDKETGNENQNHSLLPALLEEVWTHILCFHLCAPLRQNPTGFTPDQAVNLQHMQWIRPYFPQIVRITVLNVLFLLFQWVCQRIVGNTPGNSEGRGLLWVYCHQQRRDRKSSHLSGCIR